jgi:hypothetical protein
METLMYVLVGVIVIISLWRLGWFIVKSSPTWIGERRAGELLRAVLTDEEYCQLIRRGYVDIRSPNDSQRVYRVPRASGHVQMREKDGSKIWLCLQPLEWVPDPDMVVIHKLMIEADEETYLQTANQFKP